MAKALQVSLLRSLVPGEGRPATLPEKLALIDREVEKRSGRRVAYLVESGLGREIGLTDGDWRKETRKVDVVVTDNIEALYGVDLVIHTKQPVKEQLPHFRPGQGWSGFLHERANQKVAQFLRGLGVKLLPWECDPNILYAMSTRAGKSTPVILDRFSREVWQKDWRKENAFFLGGRGTVCRHAIDAMRQAGWRGEIQAFDVEEGEFIATDTEVPRTYDIFSSRNQNELLAGLQTSAVILLAALDGSGVAPKVLGPRELAIMPHNSFIIQTSIDEGGNITLPNFQTVTYWSNPFYHVSRGPKCWNVCNVPNQPGVIEPEKSSAALAQANFELLCQIFATFPNVP